MLVSQLIEDPPYLARLKGTMARFDYVGFALLAVGVGALQVALDKGQEDDWFGSRFITTLIILAAVGLVSLVIWEWRHKEPIVDVRLFKGFNFASCNLMMFVLGAVLFSSTVLLPQFLQTLMGYTAQKAGMENVQRSDVTGSSTLLCRYPHWLLAAISLLMFLLCFFLAKNEPGKGGSVAVH